MKSSLFILSICFSIIYAPSIQVQSRWNFFIETGINSGGDLRNKYRDNSNSFDNYKSQTKYRPVITLFPGIGLNYHLSKKGYLQFTAQYLKTGSNYVSEYQNISHSQYSTSYAGKTESKERINMLSMPLQGGYNFRIRKIKFGIHAGIRINYLLNYSQSYYDSRVTSKSLTPETSDYRYMLSGKDFKNLEIKRCLSGGNVGISVRMSEHFLLDFNYTASRPVSYFMYPYSDHYSSDGIYKNNLQILVGYQLGFTHNH